VGLTVFVLTVTSSPLGSDLPLDDSTASDLFWPFITAAQVTIETVITTAT
jgi:hypothetical protein